MGLKLTQSQPELGRSWELAKRINGKKLILLEKEGLLNNQTRKVWLYLPDDVGAAVVGEGAEDDNDIDAVDGVVLPLHICIRPMDASSAFLQSVKLVLHAFFKFFMES